MDKYVCDVCGYVYDPAVGDPDNGIDPGTSFDQLPEDWVCPLCGVGKDKTRWESKSPSAFLQFFLLSTLSILLWNRPH